MKKYLLFSLFFIDTIFFFAQENQSGSIPADSVKTWKSGGILALNGQQVSLTNWSAGGQNSISGAVLINLFSNYKKGKNSWDNIVDLAYGVVKQGDNKNWWKNDDRIQLTSKLGRNAFKSWYYSALIDFKTQFAGGYNYPNDSVLISDFMAPAYGLVSLGMDFKPTTDFSVYIAPATSRFTIVNNQILANSGAFGVKPAQTEVDNNGNLIILKEGELIRQEMGGYFKLNFKKKVMENIIFATTLELFSNYLDKPENIDVNWTTLTSMKVNKFISATLSTHLIYDDDILISADKNQDGIVDFNGPRVQFKQVLGVGFSYKF